MMSWSLRLWLLLFGVDGNYPCCLGYFERDRAQGGGAIEFYFETAKLVSYVSATSYGMTSGFDEYFDSLFEKTGWKIHYGLFD